jgi:hypothetical protein
MEQMQETKRHKKGDKNRPFETELCELFFKYRADKCPQIFHSYSPAYYEVLHEKRHEVKTFLEIGVGTNKVMNKICSKSYEPGASLKSWSDFFSNAKIFGLDIDKTVLFETDKIKCFYTDQSKEDSLEDTISEIKRSEGNEDLKFDVILDDGSHIIKHMKLTYKTLLKYVKDGGFYIIEDIKRKDIPVFQNLVDENFSIFKIHEGEFAQDSFIVYQKKQK